MMITVNTPPEGRGAAKMGRSVAGQDALVRAEVPKSRMRVLESGRGRGMRGFPRLACARTQGKGCGIMRTFPKLAGLPCFLRLVSGCGSSPSE